MGSRQRKYQIAIFDSQRAIFCRKRLDLKSIQLSNTILVGGLVAINFIFPYIGNNYPNWLIFFRGVQTTNQYRFIFPRNRKMNRFFHTRKSWHPSWAPWGRPGVSWGEKCGWFDLHVAWRWRERRWKRWRAMESSPQKSMIHWLVVWNIFYFPIFIGLLIIPIDFHIFQRGGPTTNQFSSSERSPYPTHGRMIGSLTYPKFWALHLALSPNGHGQAKAVWCLKSWTTKFGVSIFLSFKWDFSLNHCMFFFFHHMSDSFRRSAPFFLWCISQGFHCTAAAWSRSVRPRGRSFLQVATTASWLQQMMWVLGMSRYCNRKLVAGLLPSIWHFPTYWVANHPNWLSYFSEGWPNHQPESIPVLSSVVPWRSQSGFVNAWNRHLDEHHVWPVADAFDYIASPRVGVVPSTPAIYPLLITRDPLIYAWSSCCILTCWMRRVR